MPWPVKSPDLSLIENIWKYLKDRIARRRHRIRSIEEIEAALRQEWAKIEPKFLEKLMESMPKRIV
jgi:transposase